MFCLGRAFRWFYIVLDYATDALILRAHVGADANELNGVAESHLAFRVHAAFLDESLAQLRSRRSDLRVSDQYLGVQVL